MMKEFEKDGWVGLKKEDWMVDVSGVGEHVIQINVLDGEFESFQTTFQPHMNKYRNIIESWMTYEVNEFKRIDEPDEPLPTKTIQTKVNKELAREFALVQKFENRPMWFLFERWMNKMIEEERNN